jgi:hypothetical protein
MDDLGLRINRQTPLTGQPNVRFMYCIPYRKVSSSTYTGPRTLSPSTKESPIGVYTDKQLDLRADEVKSLLNAKIRLEHDGQLLDGEFISYEIVDGQVHAIARLDADTPGKRMLLDQIGPGKRYGSVSVGVRWPANKDGSVVTGPARIDHVAVTREPAFEGTDIMMCASKQHHDLIRVEDALCMYLQCMCKTVPLFPNSSACCLSSITAVRYEQASELTLCASMAAASATTPPPPPSSTTTAAVASTPVAVSTPPATTAQSHQPPVQHTQPPAADSDTSMVDIFRRRGYDTAEKLNKFFDEGAEKLKQADLIVAGKADELTSGAMSRFKAMGLTVPESFIRGMAQTAARDSKSEHKQFFDSLAARAAPAATTYTSTSTAPTSVQVAKTLLQQSSSAHTTAVDDVDDKPASSADVERVARGKRSAADSSDAPLAKLSHNQAELKMNASLGALVEQRLLEFNRAWDSATDAQVTAILTPKSVSTNTSSSSSSNNNNSSVY